MKFKSNFVKFALLASVFSGSAVAQSVTQPVMGLTVSGKQVEGSSVEQLEQAQVYAPVQAQSKSLNIPKSLQGSGQQQLPAPVEFVAEPTAVAVQPVDVRPNLVSADELLSPQSLNKDKAFAETEFKNKFDNTTRNSITMEQLLSEAYEKDPSVKAVRAGLKTVDEQLNQAYSGYLPTLNYTINSNREKSSINGFRDTIVTPQSDSLNLRQGLFGGGETYYSVKSAEARVQSARNELKSAEQDFLSKAITAYIEYIYAQKVLKLAENNEAVLKEQLSSSQQRFVVGDATKTDVAQSEARLANATSNKVIVTGEFINAKTNFKKYFDIDAPEILPMPSSLPNIPEKLEDALAVAFKNNPDINQAKYLNESRDYDINVRASQLLPQLDMTGSVDNSESSSSFGSILRKDSETIGLALTVPIYTQGGINYSRTREARYRKDQAQEQYRDAMETVRSNVVQAWQKIETTRSNIEATKASLLASEFALQGVREEQKEGTRTVLDVLDAEQEKFSAETSHARAIKDSVLAIYNLKLVLGELTPPQIGLAVKEYDPDVNTKNTRFKFIGL